MEHKIIMPLDIIIELDEDNNNIRQGTTIKIPLEPRYATENIYNVSSTSTIQEVFWYRDDVNWKTIMVNGGYSNNLFTPMGAIGIGVNGVPFYNFSVMTHLLRHILQHPYQQQILQIIIQQIQQQILFMDHQPQQQARHHLHIHMVLQHHWMYLYLLIIVQP